MGNVPIASVEAEGLCIVRATVCMYIGSPRPSPSLRVAQLKRETRSHARTVHIASASSRENVGPGPAPFMAAEGISWRHEAQLCRLCPSLKISDACCIVVTIVLASKMVSGVGTDTVHVLNRPVWLHFVPMYAAIASLTDCIWPDSLSLYPLSPTPGATRTQWPPALIDSGGVIHAYFQTLRSRAPRIMGTAHALSLCSVSPALRDKTTAHTRALTASSLRGERAIGFSREIDE